MKKILTRLECQRKAFLEEQRFPLQPTKSLVIKQTIMQAIKEVGLWGVALNSTKQKYFDVLDDSLFVLQKEKELELKIVQTQLSRMVYYLKMEDYDFLDSSVNAKVTFPTHFEGNILNSELVLKKQFDLILEKDNEIFVAKLSRRAPELTYRNSKNHVSNSVELMLMQMVGESLYPNRKVTPMIISLTAKDESSTTSLEEIEKKPFEEKAGKNLFYNHFDSYPEVLCREVAKAANFKIDYKSERNCTECALCEYEKICGYDNTDDVKLERLSIQEKISGNPTFTEAQKQIILFKKGDARVLAGAGSGKTTVMINRTLHLLAMDTSLKPADFLLITFTEKGVREMKEKLVYWLVNEGYSKNEAEKFDVYTFNGFGQKILDENYSLIGFNTKPRLIERMEQIDIIKDILEDAPILTNYNYRNPLLEMFRAKGVIHKAAEIILQMKDKNVLSITHFKDLFPVEQIGYRVIEDQFAFDYSTFFDMYLKYKDVLKERNLIDYSDQLNLTQSILENYDLGDKYAYRHIILDEFQDTSLEQLNMIKRLRDVSGNVESLLVCGDDAQAIFEFRGVGLENILEFPNYFPKSKTFKMVDNFRSSREIVDLANYVITFSPNNLEKDLIATREGALPKFIATDNSIEYIVNAIESTIRQGVKCEDIAVIARTRAEIKEVNNLLKKKGIPSIMSVSERLIDNQRIIGIISLSRFLKNYDDTESLMQWLQISDYNTFINEADLSKYVGIQKEIIKDEVKDLDDVKLLSWLKLQILELNCTDRAVDKLIDLLNGYSEFTPAQIFLNKMDLYRSELSVELDDVAYKAVTLTTVHSAKGREFKHVFVSYSKFKAETYSKSGKPSISRDDEEVRLLFVALTRAMDYLTVVSDNLSEIFDENLEFIQHIDLKEKA